MAMSPSVRSCFFFGFHVHLRVVYYFVGWKAEQAINKMSLLTDARCFFASIAFSILLDRCDGLGGLSLIGIANIQDLPPAEGQIRILLLTLLGIGFLMFLGCLGCICCFCRMSPTASSKSDGLDVYAPRTQSIVWPTLPQEAARVLDMTFRHVPTPGCPCRTCRSNRNSSCIENCGAITQFAFSSSMRQSGKESAARWLFLVATSITWLQLMKTDDNFTDFDWLNETQLLQLYEYEYDESENETFENFTESSEDLRELVHNFIIENNSTDIGDNTNSTDNSNSTNNSTISRNTDNNSSIPEEKVPFEETRKSHHMSRVLIMALFLHIALIGAGITIYSCVYCKMQTLKLRRRSLEARRRLQLMRMQTQHVPNIGECPCHGCIMAREMVQGLIMQQFQELVEC
ncbi:uncharacterized protein Dana_GF12457 [Drosophila ananassae]|uniref:Uncharacterized protein n=1 Tax=Drosophila ananassae TaxID=7217 RepID=B3ME83_DROAN|nr:uncharacterized protein Dana_GF12457 [Drosophila ananassae]